MSKYTTEVNKDDSITVSDGQWSFVFREPRGRDLVKLDSLVKEAGLEVSDTEKMAMVCSVLNGSKTPDDFLDLKLGFFKYISAQIDNFFQSEG